MGQKRELGQLTFTPYDNCLGIDMLDILIVENPLLDTQVTLSAGGRLLLQIQNRFDNPEVFFYKCDVKPTHCATKCDRVRGC